MRLFQDDANLEEFSRIEETNDQLVRGIGKWMDLKLGSLEGIG
jgi:hypothetical protein